MDSEKQSRLKFGVIALLAVALAVIMFALPQRIREEFSWDPKKVLEVLQELSLDYLKHKNPWRLSGKMDCYFGGCWEFDVILKAIGSVSPSEPPPPSQDPDFRNFVLMLMDWLKKDRGFFSSPQSDEVVLFIRAKYVLITLVKLASKYPQGQDIFSTLFSHDKDVPEAKLWLGPLIPYHRDRFKFVHIAARKPRVTDNKSVTVTELFHVAGYLAKNEVDSLVREIKDLDKNLESFLNSLNLDLREEVAIIIEARSGEDPQPVQDLQTKLDGLKFKVPVYVIYTDRDGYVQGGCTGKCPSDWQERLDRIAHDIFEAGTGEKPPWWLDMP